MRCGIHDPVVVVRFFPMSELCGRWFRTDVFRAKDFIFVYSSSQRIFSSKLQDERKKSFAHTVLPCGTGTSRMK